MLGSVCHPDARVRRKAIDHLLECVDIMDATGSRDLKLWFADGTNYPARTTSATARTGSPRRSRRSTPGSATDQRLVLEYKFFEPAFYATDVPDWGTAYVHCLALGERRRWSSSTPATTRRAPTSSSSSRSCCGLGRLGAFDFNSRFYADDDLMVGAADPFQLFRIMFEVVRGGGYADAGRRVHARPVPQHRAEDPGPDPVGDERAGGDGQGAARRPRTRSPRRSAAGDVLGANAVLMDAFNTDVRPLLAELRERAWASTADPMRGLPALRLRRADRRRAGRRAAGRVGRMSVDDRAPPMPALLDRSQPARRRSRGTPTTPAATRRPRATATDPVTGEPVELLWVKGSGGDLGTLTEAGLAVLRLDRLRALVDVYPGVEREDEMVAAFDYCLHGTRRRGAVDRHRHARPRRRRPRRPPPPRRRHRDRHRRRRRGADQGDLRRPGGVGAVAAARLPARPRHRRHPATPTRRRSACVLGGHGITAWGDDLRGVRGQLAGDHPARPRRYIAEHGRAGAVRRRSCPGSSRCPSDERRERAAALLPVVRGLASTDRPQVGHFTDSERRARLPRPRASIRALAALGTSCPDHFLRTKVAPLVLDLPPTRRSRTSRRPAARAARGLPRRLRGLLRAPRDPGQPGDARRRPGDRAGARRRHVLASARTSRPPASPASSTSTPST